MSSTSFLLAAICLVVFYLCHKFWIFSLDMLSCDICYEDILCVYMNKIFCASVFQAGNRHKASIYKGAVIHRGRLIHQFLYCISFKTNICVDTKGAL